MTGFIFTIPGQPVPKGRPRVLRNGITYTPKRTVEAEKAVAVAARMVRGAIPPDAEGLYCLNATFYVQGQRKADLDNLVKLVMDGMAGVIYRNDKQVRCFRDVSVEYGEMEPRTEVTISRMPQVGCKPQSPFAAHEGSC